MRDGIESATFTVDMRENVNAGYLNRDGMDPGRCWQATTSRLRDPQHLNGGGTCPRDGPPPPHCPLAKQAGFSQGARDFKGSIPRLGSGNSAQNEGQASESADKPVGARQPQD
jgi:hypothetical protein